MPAPQKILDLIERFERNIEDYKTGKYNETQVRREFVDPLLKELGWDIDNEKGYAEAYKEVIHEDAIKISGSHKAPDYCMRVGGVRKFFVEAKKPAVNVKEDVDPAFQVRRYAWSAKLPLSILTDFEEFAIYDCRLKPTKTDKASKARIFYCTFKEYAEKWDELQAIFSKDAILKGSFDKYAESSKTKRGTEEVDEAFLKEIERWRDLLARNVALRNPELTQRELNYAVQVTIDRLVFLRICEDRGIEQYGKLLAEVNGTDIYGRLKQHFRDADDRYNSGLFHFQDEKEQAEAPDTLTLGLQIDDKVLKDIISHLYYPDSPYEFSVLPSDILGQVYEQFLGKVIRLTEGHQAKIEEKPEVRKAGGVYYTPTYIVEYIVEQTVGKLLEGKTPKEVSKLTICDPACGSGSFLLGAYQKLLDWHLLYYVENEPDKWKKELCEGPQGDWRLTTTERKRILLNNIYGVDIDAQAVEVTKLSLLLKVLEGETDQTLGKQLSMFKERVLPDLGSNIKCGNSLIGPDFYSTQQMGIFDEEETYRINVFDWEKGFPTVFSGKTPGFDAIIGNPPYIRIQALKEWAPVEVEYYKKRYKSASAGNYDIYVVFIEKALLLLNKKGFLGYILPHKFFNAKYGEPVREIITKENHLQRIIHFGDQQVFKGATTYTCLLFLGGAPSPHFFVEKVNDLQTWKLNVSKEISAPNNKLSSNKFTSKEWNFVYGQGADIYERLQAVQPTLGEVAKIFQGLVTGADKVFILDDPKKIEEEILKPFLVPDNLRPYSYPIISNKILFPYSLKDGKASLLSSGFLQSENPFAWSYLKENEDILRNRERGKWNVDHWYAFGRSQNLKEMDDPKLIIQVTANRPTVIYDDRGLYMTGGGSGPFYGIRPQDKRIDMKYLLGILNSQLFGWIIQQQSTQLRGGYWKFSKQYIEKAPIIMPETNKSLSNQIIAYVDQLLSVNKQLSESKTPHQHDQLNQLISVIEKNINNAVFDLYGLSEDEVEMIESSFSSK